jgi:DNA-binding NarL/FixJ family response regulator
VIRVFVLADSIESAQHLAAFVVEDGRFEVVGASSEILFRANKLDGNSPDVILASRIAVNRLPKSRRPVVLLNDNGLHDWELGGSVKAHLPMHASPGELAAALIAAAQGLTVLTAAQAESVLNVTPLANGEAELLVERLTRRETEVLRMMGDGSANKEIADELRISENTVKFHVAAILGKLNATSRTEAVARGIRTGLIPI